MIRRLALAALILLGVIVLWIGSIIAMNIGMIWLAGTSHRPYL